RCSGHRRDWRHRLWSDPRRHGSGDGRVRLRSAGPRGEDRLRCARPRPVGVWLDGGRRPFRIDARRCHRPRGGRFQLLEAPGRRRPRARRGGGRVLVWWELRCFRRETRC
ncbi:unnamed protein product, partial [Ectocarpus sp. 8 AP-2014]